MRGALVVAEPQTQPKKTRYQVSLWVDPSFHERLQAIAVVRGTKAATTAAWLLDRAMTEFEGLSRDQKASA